MEEAGGSPLALGMEAIRKIWTGDEACVLSGATWTPPHLGWEAGVGEEAEVGGKCCDCGLRKRASLATLSADQCPQQPAEPPRQRNGCGAVWLLVPRGRGPLWGVRPGHPGRSGECPRGVKPAGCPGRAILAPPLAPRVLGQSPAGVAGAGAVSVCVGVLCVHARACVRVFLGV